jgi:hypothetical protein
MCGEAIRPELDEKRKCFVHIASREVSQVVWQPGWGDRVWPTNLQVIKWSGSRPKELKEVQVLLKACWWTGAIGFSQPWPDPRNTPRAAAEALEIGLRSIFLHPTRAETANVAQLSDRRRQSRSGGMVERALISAPRAKLGVNRAEVLADGDELNKVLHLLNKQSQVSSPRRGRLLLLAVCRRRYNWSQETAGRRQRASVDLLRPAAPFQLCAWQPLPSSRASTLAARSDCPVFEERLFRRGITLCEATKEKAMLWTANLRNKNQKLCRLYPR